MKSNLEKVSNLECRLNIQVPAADVGATFDRFFKNVQKQAHLKGFRPGKAPMATIRSVYGDRIKQDVVQDLIQKHYVEALKEHSVDPISYPEFEFDQPTEDKDFAFSVLFEVRPAVGLKKYEGLDVEKEEFQVEESKIDQVLTNIRASRATEVPVLEDRPAQNGDVAVIDFDGFVDAKPLDGGKGVDHSLELGSKSFIDGFEDGILGMKIGATKTLNLKFPSPYQAAELAGKAVEFKVVLKALKKKELPELTDEFLKSIGATETLTELRGTIRKDLEESEQKRIEQDFKNKILKQLVKNNPIDVPPSMLRDQKKTLVDDMKQKMVEQGMSDEEFKDYAQKWEGDFNTTASEMIQAGFLVDAIAAKENLRCTPEDIDKKIDEYAKQTGIELEKIRNFYTSPEQTQRLNYMITEEKVIGFLTKSAKIKLVPPTKTT